LFDKEEQKPVFKQPVFTVTKQNNNLFYEPVAGFY